jgi:hypothetical protein
METKIIPDLRVFHHFPEEASEQTKTSSHGLINVSISNDKGMLQAYK